MSSAAAPDPAEICIAKLRALEPELRQSGIKQMALFGSMARGEARAGSDVDLLVVLDPETRMGLIGLIRLERRIERALGRPVELVPEPIERPRLRANIARDRRNVF